MQLVCILLDTSGSMRGGLIAAVNMGLASMVSTLRAYPMYGISPNRPYASAM